MRFFAEFFKSRVSAIFIEFLVSQSHWFRRKYEISEENGRLFFRICEKYEVSPLFFEYQISYSVIFGENLELSEEIWKISRNFSENWKMRKSKIISDKYFHQGVFDKRLSSYNLLLCKYRTLRAWISVWEFLLPDSGQRNQRRQSAVYPCQHEMPLTTFDVFILPNTPVVNWLYNRN